MEPPKSDYQAHPNCIILAKSFTCNHGGVKKPATWIADSTQSFCKQDKFCVLAKNSTPIAYSAVDPSKIKALGLFCCPTCLHEEDDDYDFDSKPPSPHFVAQNVCATDTVTCKNCGTLVSPWKITAFLSDIRTYSGVEGHACRAKLQRAAEQKKIQALFEETERRRNCALEALRLRIASGEIKDHNELYERVKQFSSVHFSDEEYKQLATLFLEKVDLDLVERFPAAVSVLAKALARDTHFVAEDCQFCFTKGSEVKLRMCADLEFHVTNARIKDTPLLLVGCTANHCPRKCKTCRKREGASGPA